MGVRLLLWCLLVFLVGGVVYAGGQGEDALETARRLIEEKRYNRAIEIITQVMREDPDRMEEAEALLARVRMVRGDFNALYAELIEVLYVQRDVERALRIIEELEGMDEEPDPAVRESLARAKETARFVYNQDRFRGIMEEGARLLDAGRYAEAVRLYQEGFGLYREEFFSSQYGNVILDEVGRVVSRLEGVAGGLSEVLADFEDAWKGYAAVVEGGGVDEVVEGYAALREAAFRLAAARREVFRLGRVVAWENLRVMESAGLEREDFFLGFMQRFVLGRVQVREREGVVGALERALLEGLGGVSAGLERRLEGVVQEGFGGTEVWEDAMRLAGVMVRLQECWGASGVWERGGMGDWEREIVGRGGRAVVVGRAYGAVAGAMERLGEVRGVGEPEGDVDVRLAAVRERVAGVRGVMGELEEVVRVFEGRFGAFGGRDAARVVRGAVRHLEGVAAEEERRAVRVVVEALVGDVGRMEEGVKEGAAMVQGVRELLEGREEVVEVGGTLQTVLAKYPREALALAEEAEQALQGYLSFHASRSRVYAALEEYLRSDEGVERLVAGFDSSAEEARALLETLQGLKGQAREQSLLAERYRNEGLKKLQDAERSIEREAYEEARTLLSEAGELFATSFSYQEDPDLRREVDARLIALSERIVSEENQRIIREVRSLITQGREQYLLGNFEEAERLLLRAQARWRVTHTEDNEEVVYWLKFVRAALAVQRGRIISETDPLYSEITQLLNLARQDYQRASTLIEGGRRDEGMGLLDQAVEKLLRVRMAFPLNRDASILLLRIEQLRNPDNFDALFRRRIDEAIAKLNTAPQEAYVELQDLAAIRPDFPGLKDAIYRAEITLGIRVPPPDPRNIARSKELYAQALEIFNRNDRANFPVALEQLNQAITLDPDNQDAVVLKDRIQLAMGAQTTVTLPSYALRRYKEAEQKYVEGRYYEALAIVQELLADERAKRYPPLLELKRRIESRL